MRLILYTSNITSQSVGPEEQPEEEESARVLRYGPDRCLCLCRGDPILG